MIHLFKVRKFFFIHPASVGLHHLYADAIMIQGRSAVGKIFNVKSDEQNIVNESKYQQQQYRFEMKDLFHFMNNDSHRLHLLFCKDSCFSEKILLSETIQACQTQAR